MTFWIRSLGLELDAPRQPFDDRRFADARLADQHHGIRALTVAQDFQNLLDLLVAAEHRRQPVLAREQVQIRGEMLEERRQLEPLLQALFAQLHVAHFRVQPVREHFGLDAVAPDDRYGNALRFLKHRREQIGRFNRLASGAAAMVQRELEDELRRRRDAKLAARKRRHHVQMLLDRLQDGVRV